MVVKRRRSHSLDRGRQNSSEQNQSRSSSKAASILNSSRVEEEKFYVPYRCLIPPDAAGVLIGRGAVQLRCLTSETNVKCSVLRSEDNPPGLKDRILILNGVQKDKDLAMKWVLRQMRGAGHGESYKTTFVFMLPSEAASPVIGTRGSVVHEISSRTGTEIDVMKSVIVGTTDRAVTIRGSVDGIVHAMSRMHSIVQGMHEQGKLTRKDFAFCEIFPPKNSETISFTVPEEQASNTPLTLTITKNEGDWLVSPDQLEKVKKIEELNDCLVTLEEVEGIEEEGLCVVGCATFGLKQKVVEQLLTLLIEKNRNKPKAGIVVEDSFATSEKPGVFESIESQSGCRVKYSKPVVLLEAESASQILHAANLVLARIEIFYKMNPTSIKSEKERKICLKVNPSEGRLVEDLLRSKKFPQISATVNRSMTEIEIFGHKSAIAKTVLHLLTVIGDPTPAEYEEVDYELI